MIISHVSDCFQPAVDDKIPIELSNDTKEFEVLYRRMNRCLSEHYNTSSHQYNQSVCIDCSQHYNTLNTKYKYMKNKVEGENICMDVIDAVSVLAV
jgi:hypothetical protein